MSVELISVIEPLKNNNIPKLNQNSLVWIQLRKCKENYPDGITPVKLAELLDIPNASVRRILAGLVSMGWAERKQVHQSLSYYRSLL